MNLRLRCNSVKPVGTGKLRAFSCKIFTLNEDRVNGRAYLGTRVDVTLQESEKSSIHYDVAGVTPVTDAMDDVRAFINDAKNVAIGVEFLAQALRGQKVRLLGGRDESVLMIDLPVRFSSFSYALTKTLGLDTL